VIFARVLSQTEVHSQTQIDLVSARVRARWVCVGEVRARRAGGALRKKETAATTAESIDSQPLNFMLASHAMTWSNGIDDPRWVELAGRFGEHLTAKCGPARTEQ